MTDGKTLHQKNAPERGAYQLSADQEDQTVTLTIASPQGEVHVILTGLQALNMASRIVDAAELLTATTTH